MVASLFSDEIKELFEIIETAHDKYAHDLTTVELFELWKDINPVATRAEVNAMGELINEIENEDLLSEDITVDIIDGLWKRDIGKKVGNLGIAIAEGKLDAFDRLKKLIEHVEDGFRPDDFADPITDDILELLSVTGLDGGWHFNLTELDRHVGTIGPGICVIIFARPETGKTADVISNAAGPGGWSEQGAKVLYLGNEEDVRRTKLRAIMANTGMTKDEILANPQKAKEIYSKIADNLIMQSSHDWAISRVEAYVNKIQPDILIVDQLDKCTIEDNTLKGHEKLRELYIQGRAIGNRYNCAVVFLSQASVDAEGHTILTPNMMEGSKTGKYAEADLIIGIGKGPDHADGTPEIMRFLTVGKNKLTGWHGTMVCRLNAKISRYEN